MAVQDRVKWIVISEYCSPARNILYFMSVHTTASISSSIIVGLDSALLDKNWEPTYTRVHLPEVNWYYLTKSNPCLLALVHNYVHLLR